MGGIGVAAGNFGLAAAIGRIIAGACAAGAQINYEASKCLVDFDYLECKKKLIMKNFTRVMDNDKSLILKLISVFVLLFRYIKLFNIEILLPFLVFMFVWYFTFYIIKNKDYSILSLTIMTSLLFLIVIKLVFS